jgi:ketosteroid isomerase-like protein
MLWWLAMTHDEARQFASEWVEAWNRHDIDAVLTHYDAPDMFLQAVGKILGVTFTSNNSE